MGLKVIVTGTTGMVGEGVLLECIRDERVEKVLTIARRNVDIQHPKLEIRLLNDFMEPGAVENDIKGYDACYFCLGVSSIGMNEDEYTAKTYTLTMNFAKMLSRQNPGMTFCYVSGASTDSTEKGKSMWARVKGRTENDLIKLFQKAYMFRPGYMQPTRGQKRALSFYKYVGWMYPLLRSAFPRFVSSLAEVGQAMINCTIKGFPKNILEVKDIKEAAKK
jgi:hypothetical protein